MSSFGFDFLHFPRKLWAFHSRLSVNWIKSSHANQSIKCVVFLTSQWGRLFTFLCVVKILHSITIKGFFTQILVVALLQNNLLMLLSNYGCTWEVWRALKKPQLLTATSRATLTHFSCSPNFSRASITRYTQAKHEQILKLLVHNVHEKALQRVKTDEILKTCACYL